jgi:hypothetical protein
MTEKYDPLDNDKTMMNLDASLGDMPTMRLDDESIGKVDRYELIEKLGEGGFGAVYGARDTEAGILVALKSLPAEISCDADEMASIRGNFALVSRLSHPHIAGLKHLHRVEYSDEKAQSALGVKSGDYLVVMEYAPGATLFNVRLSVPEQQLPLEQVLKLARQIAEALDYAHGKRVLHRDIKPKNVMVNLADGQEVKVLDFGLAAEIRSSMSRKSRDPQNSKSGTPNYMAPEQWKGTAQNAATDQYALAAMVYELVGGSVPFKPAFDTGNFEIMRNAVCNEPVPPVAELDKKQNAVLLRALAKNPAERFASCCDFVAALSGGKIGKPRKTRNGGKLVAGLLIAGLLGGGAFFGVRWLDTAFKQKARQEQVTAETQARVDGLLGEARSALNVGDLGVATEKAQAVLALVSGNDNAQALLLEIETKAGERNAREMKVEAELAFEKLERDISDRDQGFAEKFAALNKAQLIALDAYGNKSWGQAFTAFKGVLGECAAVRALDDDRKDAKAQRDAVGSSRNGAEAQRAETLAKPDYEKAVGTDRRAVRLFKDGAFDEASAAWKAAVQQFGSARTYAVAVSAYQSAKKEWESRISSREQGISKEQLRQYASTEWTAAEKAARMGAASANEPAQGKRHYETALRILHGLDRFSEDMDFSLIAPDAVFDFTAYCTFVEKELTAWGFPVTVEVEHKTADSAIESAFLKVETLTQMMRIEAPAHVLGGLHRNQVLKIKVEVDTDPPLDFATESKFLLQPIPFAVRTYTLPSLFAGKMHVLLFRKWGRRVKGRDWYDLVWYVAKGIPLDLRHLSARMRQTGHWDSAAILSEEDFRACLGECIANLDVDAARADVEPFLKNRDSVAVWSTAFFSQLAERVSVV